MKTVSKTSFGYRDVSEHEKPALVRGVFASVARRYDVMNDLMSGGVHRLWKDAMVEWLNPQPGYRVIDVAGGTRGICFSFFGLGPRPGGNSKKHRFGAAHRKIPERGRRRARGGGA